MGNGQRNPKDAHRYPQDVHLEAETLLVDYLQRKKIDLEAAASTVRRCEFSGAFL